MFVYEFVGSEEHPVYQTLTIENLERQYSFLRSAVTASLDLRRPFLSLEVILALNYHAISCLHGNAGVLRPCPVTVGPHNPPFFWEVPAHMSMFIDEVNHHWHAMDPVSLAAYVLWKLNYIHPFVNGNGRTARVACYFVLCCRIGRLLGGDVTLPELLKRDRADYVTALRQVDANYHAGKPDLTPLHALLVKLLDEQMATVTPDTPPEEAAPV